ncbi:MAG: sugar phosphate isomerase/epimerase [Ruminococcaceae bacterium]|nr:sugar phosphate isomerase/epimerase [Oscillospiraceae bacterium]
MNSFIISGFSDEIDSSVSVQFEHISSLGISYFEPRGIDGKNISEINDSELALLKEKMASFKIKASSIGSPIGKILVTEPFEPHFELFKRVVQIAEELNCKYIRIFSFFIPEGDAPEMHKDEVIRRMKEFVKYAESKGVILLHENEKDIYGDTAKRCFELLTEIDSPNLRSVFDPANFIQCDEETYPYAYNLLKPFIQYIHIKDSDENKNIVPAGMGKGKIKELLSALKESGYNGFLSLEPHLGSFVGINNLEIDDKMEKLEKSTPQKFTLAYNSLMKIIEEI